MGTPERPLSDLGKVSYKSFWTDTILKLLAKHENYTLRDISETTYIHPDDVLETLHGLGLTSYWKGSYILNKINQKVIQDHLRKKPKSAAGKRLNFYASKLNWRKPKASENQRP
jgi:hypothetical protein